MAFEVELIEEAKLDYHEIIDWYEKQETGLGLRFYLVMTEIFQKLENHPLNYGLYSKPFRQIILKDFPYRIVFKVDKTNVRILAIFHTSRSHKILRKRLQ